MTLTKQNRDLGVGVSISLLSVLPGKTLASMTMSIASVSMGTASGSSMGSICTSSSGTLSARLLSGLQERGAI